MFVATYSDLHTGEAITRVKSSMREAAIAEAERTARAWVSARNARVTKGPGLSVSCLAMKVEEEKQHG